MPILADFRRNHPGIRLKLVNASTPAMLEEVLNGHMDFAVLVLNSGYCHDELLVTRLTDGRWLDMGGHRLLLDRCNGMERSAFVDPLTGAYTRRYFDKFLAGGEMHGGVAMIDVNQFKSVNDSFGHLVGDEALQTVAAAMQSCLRQTDILIRYGGDEFLLLMPQNCPDGVESVIRRVQNAVQAARVPSHPELRLSVSIGGVCNVQPLTEAIRQADARMYCNKENGEPVL